MSLVPHCFEYTVEVLINEDLDKNNECIMNYVNSAFPPFQIQFWKDDEEKKVRTYQITSPVNVHNIIYSLFGPLNPLYSCYFKTRIHM